MTMMKDGEKMQSYHLDDRPVEVNRFDWSVSGQHPKDSNKHHRPNVAKTLIQAVRSRVKTSNCHRDKQLNGLAIRDETESSIIHSDGDSKRQKTKQHWFNRPFFQRHQTRSKSHSPFLPRIPLNRHQFPVDLQKFNSALRRQAKTPGTVRNTANGRKLTRQLSLVESSKLPITRCSSSPGKLDGDSPGEHRLIAYKSALLDSSSSGVDARQSLDEEEACCSKDCQSRQLFLPPQLNIIAKSPSIDDPFLHVRNRLCTSFRLRIPTMRNPVDMCALPDRRLAIADYDNGFLVVNCAGDCMKHGRTASHACGVVYCRRSNKLDDFSLLVLGYKDGQWTMQSFSAQAEFEPSGAPILCPNNEFIEKWALRKLIMSDDERLFLMATGEQRTMIWIYSDQCWSELIKENSRKGIYSDFAVRHDSNTGETHFILCDYRRSQLTTIVLNKAEELAGIRSIRMRRVKGQEWIAQGPKLAVWDADRDIVLFDGSGKLFCFDGERFQCRRIIGDVGKGEVGAIAVRAGWCYALCRHRMCIDAFLYKQRGNQVFETAL